MQISDRFRSSTLSSFDEVAGINGAGPQTVTATNLETALDTLVPQAQDAITDDSSHAIPNPMSYICSFVDTICRINQELQWQATADDKRNYLRNLSNKDSQRYMEWLGLCATVALRHIYSMYGLDVQLVQIDGQHNSVFQMLSPILATMGPDYDWQRNNFYYITINGEHVAIYHTVIGLCPIQKYNKTSFADKLPWYDRENGWQNPFVVLQADAYALNRFKQWMNSNDFTSVVAAYGECGSPIPTCDNWGTTTTNLQYDLNNASQNRHNNKAQKFSNACCAYTDTENNPQPPMPNLFTDRLMLARQAEEQENHMGCYCEEVWQNLSLICDNGFSFPPKVTYVPVFPFTTDACNMLDKVFTIQQVSFTAKGSSSGGTTTLACVEVSIDIQFKTGMQETTTIKKTYWGNNEKICATRIPTLCIWPSVDLPVDFNWKYYVATSMLPTVTTFDDVSGVSSLAEDAKLSMDKGESHNVHEMNDPDVNHNWEVTKSDAEFSYAVVMCDAEAFGVVFVRKNGTVENNQGTGHTVSIDFGTTSTVCAILAPSGNNPVALPFHDYTRVVTMSNRNEQKNELIEIAEKRFLGKVSPANVNQNVSLHQGKVMTVSQVYGTNQEEKTLPFITSRFFLSNGNLLCAYSGHDSSFAGRGIFNDLKLVENPTKNEDQATVIFLAGIYINALLYTHGEKRDPTPLQPLKVSVPHASFKNRLSGRWTTASEIVNNCIGNEQYHLKPNNIQYFTESYAVRNNPGYLDGDVIVDIGGGTVDLSIVGTEQTASFKYAGREIMINSITELYRQWKTTDKSEDQRNAHFKKLWGNATSAAKDALITDFLQKTSTQESNLEKVQRRTRDESLRLFIEVLMNDFGLTVPVETADGYILLHELITTKFSFLMSLVAEFIKQNKNTLWDRGTPGRIGVTQARCINLHFVGTASKTLEHICQNQNLSGYLNGTVDSQTGNPFLRQMGAMINAQTKDLQFIIVPRLSANVADKTQVAYGMLAENATPNIVTPTANDNQKYKNTIIEMETEKLLALEPAQIFTQFSSDLQNSEYQEENFEKDALRTEIANALNDMDSKTISNIYQKLVRDDRYKKLSEYGESCRDSTELKEFSSQISALILSGEGFTAGTDYGTIRQGTDLGMGPDVTSLTNVIPRSARTDEFYQSVSRCLQKVIRDDRCLHSLLDQENDDYRMQLLKVYVADAVIDEFIGKKQIS